MKGPRHRPVRDLPYAGRLCSAACAQKWSQEVYKSPSIASQRCPVHIAQAESVLECLGQVSFALLVQHGRV